MSKPKAPKPINPGCSFANHDVSMKKLLCLKVLDGQITVPICTDCVRYCKRQGIDAKAHFEREIREYIASHPAFWHSERDEKEAK